MVLKVTSRRVEFPHNGGVRIYFKTTTPFPFTLAGNRVVGNLVNSRDSVPVPGFRTLIRKGECATSPFTGQYREVVSSQRSLLRVTIEEVPSWGNEVTESWFETAGGPDGLPLFNHQSTSDSLADGQALIRARAAVKSRQQHMSGFTFLGELRETIRMIRNPADAILRNLSEYFRTLRKRKRTIRRGLKADAQRKALVDIATDMWLGVSFGLKPLLTDIKDIAETLARNQVADQRHDYVRGYGKEVVSNLVNEYESPMVGNIYGRGRTIRTTTRTVVYRCHIRATDTSASVGSLKRLSELSGFRTEDFVPSVYQLIPFSFLLDYFSNLGDVIEAHCTSVSDVDWVNRSEVIETVQKTYLNLFPVNFNTNRFVITKAMFDNGISEARTTSRLKTVYRSKQSTIGTPSLEFSLPGSDSTKWNNILALLSAANRRTLRF